MTNAERTAKSRAKMRRVELLFKPEEYAALKADADAARETVAGYIKRRLKKR